MNALDRRRLNPWEAVVQVSWGRILGRPDFGEERTARLPNRYATEARAKRAAHRFGSEWRKQLGKENDPTFRILTQARDVNEVNLAGAAKFLRKG